jgi:hypothetical protein
MNADLSEIKNVDSNRLTVLRNLPKNILETFTRDEIKIFLYEDVWPDSLKEKLKDYLKDK